VARKSGGERKHPKNKKGEENYGRRLGEPWDGSEDLPKRGVLGCGAKTRRGRTGKIGWQAAVNGTVQGQAV